MKICMLGAGALGSTIGGTLAKGGSEVYFIDQWEEHINKINEKGLKLTDGKEDYFVNVKGKTSPEGIGYADLVIVLVKSFATKTAIENASSIIGPNTLVMSLQNGLGNEEVIAEVVGKERVLGGKTYVGGVLLEAGYVSAGVKGKYTYIGELDGKMTERVKAVADEFNKAGLLCEVSDNITGMIWDKLLINVATGALSGITRLPYGGLYDEPRIKACAVAAVQEGINVAKAVGVKLKSEDPEYAWNAASEGLPPTFKASILQSIEMGRPTEVTFINGSVVEWGKKYGIPTPVNETLVACVTGIERWLKDYANKQ
ncbi:MULTISPECIES: ketopantoate reductase family protein [Clostridium]|uniref:ketopantoate reductase family protein n=1 Tax=Clostridium TaxID=1485 RepID=UPI000983EE15|nr:MULTISPECIES: ketopantoate reductase family protein [Clostridium]AQR97464.1 2-dehydropantoate 2-reductase [Clostridium saccharoperbutylacetonicum]NSB33348.1 2-dehydropantoate 2-reductase [Clostridium saccharoperbutylacetonicum]